MEVSLSKTALVALDWFFLVFHTVFTLFNMVGWIPEKTRKFHLITMGLTAASWFILGIWYGLGFCFCTEWHWQVREALGNPIQSYSYIHFLIGEITGLDPDPALVDRAVMGIFIFCAVMTLSLNFRDFRKRGDSVN